MHTPSRTPCLNYRSSASSFSFSRRPCCPKKYCCWRSCLSLIDGRPCHPCRRQPGVTLAVAPAAGSSMAAARGTAWASRALGPTGPCPALVADRRCHLRRPRRAGHFHPCRRSRVAPAVAGQAAAPYPGAAACRGAASYQASCPACLGVTCPWVGPHRVRTVHCPTKGLVLLQAPMVHCHHLEANRPCQVQWHWHQSQGNQGHWRNQCQHQQGHVSTKPHRPP